MPTFFGLAKPAAGRMVNRRAMTTAPARPGWLHNLAEPPQAHSREASVAIHFLARHRATGGTPGLAGTGPRLPVLRTLTRDEFDELFSALEQPTGDDVPWRFPVRSPLNKKSGRT